MVNITEYIVYIWLIPVVLTIVIPLAMAAVWAPVKIVRALISAARNRSPRSAPLQLPFTGQCSKTSFSGVEIYLDNN